MTANPWKLTLTLALFWTFVPERAWGFEDARGHFAQSCIAQLGAQNLVSGYPDRTFRPNATITRAEFAVLMLNTFPTARVKRGAIPFTDVPSSHWAYSAIRQATEREFFAGYPDRTFKPSQPIPRVQAIAVLGNALNLPSPEQPEAILAKAFEDGAEVPNYARKAIAAATWGRVIVNFPKAQQLRPNQSAKRGEVAAFLCQARNFVNTVPAEYVGGNQWFAVLPEMGGTGRYSEGLVVAEKAGKYGYLDKAGKAAIAPQFDEGKAFSEGLAAVRRGQQWGYINPQGNWVIQPQYKEAGRFAEGLAAVTLGEEYRLIDNQGQTVARFSAADFAAFLNPGEFLHAVQFDPFSDGRARVTINNQLMGFLDRAGNWAIPLQRLLVNNFAEGLAAIQVNGKYGYIDTDGNEAIAPQFEQAQDFSEGLAGVEIPGDSRSPRWGYIDRTGKFAIAPQFYWSQRFSEGLAGVNDSEGLGYIDRTGKKVISGEFRALRSDHQPLYPFSDGLALVRLGETAGFIDKTGKFAIAPQFADATSFADGLARITLAGRWEQELGFGGEQSPVIDYRLVGGKWGYIRIEQ